MSMRVMKEVEVTPSFTFFQKHGILFCNTYRYGCLILASKFDKDSCTMKLGMLKPWNAETIFTADAIASANIKVSLASLF